MKHIQILVRNDKNLIANVITIVFSRSVRSERPSSCFFSPFLIFAKNGHNLSWNLLSRRETICARRKNDSWRYLPLERICLDARSSFSHLLFPLHPVTSDFRSKKPSTAIIARSRGTDHPRRPSLPLSPPRLGRGARGGWWRFAFLSGTTLKLMMADTARWPKRARCISLWSSRTSE